MRLLTALLLPAAIPPLSAYDPPRPNIVVILCDDLGYGDLQNYGHPHIETPRLMQMAAEGAQFSDFYSAAPVCSPSRVGLLTGRNPNRAGVYDWIPEADPSKPPRSSRDFVEMRKEEFTIPRMLAGVGYATCMVGKWHCNAMFNSEKQAQPHDHGFEHWFATQNNAAPSHENPVNFVRNGEPVGEIEGYSCRIVAEEFVDWLESLHAAGDERPFFAYVAYHEPHEPVASPPDLVEKYLAKVARNEDEAQYFANVENLDAATGTILDALERLGHDEDTLVIFTSDNGPERLNRYPRANRSYGSPGKLRGMKLHTHEAGYRVAGIMRWPGTIPAGLQSDEPVCSLDFLPTFARLAGAPLEKPFYSTLDGTELNPAWEGKRIKREKPLFWVYYRSHLEDGKYLPSLSMRDGDKKVRAMLEPLDGLSNIDEGNSAQVLAAKPVAHELYDLVEDPGESNPLPLEGSELPARLDALYREAVETFPVWPTISPPAP